MRVPKLRQRLQSISARTALLVFSASPAVASATMRLCHGFQQFYA